MSSTPRVSAPIDVIAEKDEAVLAGPVGQVGQKPAQGVALPVNVADGDDPAAGRERFGWRGH
jgi:hypothetical protein